jgi:phospholipid/cholesterol/gamma-HCH transport system substrate-binding protein
VRPRLGLTATAAATAGVLLTGCGFHGVYSLPLPGAAGSHGRTYSVKVQLADVLDLVPYSAVKVNDATVGHVSAVRVEGTHALVTCRLPLSVRLPANTVARVEQTSVLGEKFVELEPPTAEPPTGRLVDGAVIPLTRTTTDASVEEVLGALSALLTDGGVDQLHTITHELSVALSGRSTVSRDLLERLTAFTAGLDAQRGSIIRAIDGLDHLAATVRRQESSLVGALQVMPGALRILADDRRRLTTMLVSVGHLGDVAAHVVAASRTDLVANLRSLEPTLRRLAEVGDVIPQTLGVLLTYPTADTVEQEYFGDYGNLSLTLDVSAASLLATFAPTGKNGRAATGGRAGSQSPQPPTGSSGPSLPGLPALPPPATRWLPGHSVGDLMLGALS